MKNETNPNRTDTMTDDTDRIPLKARKALAMFAEAQAAAKLPERGKVDTTALDAFADAPTPDDAYELGTEARQMGAPRATPTGLPRGLGRNFIAGWDAADRMIRGKDSADVADPKAPRSAR